MIVSMAMASLLALSPAKVDAQTKIFMPEVKRAHAVIFNPKGVAPEQVRRASVKLYKRGHVAKRRLKIRRVRRAMRGGHGIKVHKPHRVRKAQLVIDAKNKVGLCGAGAFGPANVPGSCWRPYSASSPFNRGVAGTPRAANSSAIVSQLTSFGPPQKVVGGIAGTGDDWSHPVYFSRPTDPLYTVHCTEPYGCDLEGMQVRVPARAEAAGGGDAHLGVIDQLSGWEYDFWQVKDKPAAGGTLVVAGGGRTRVDGDGLGAGATAAGFGLAAGVIRPAELAAGHIDHAISIIVKCSNGTAVWPAVSNATGTPCSDKGGSDANAPAIGQHFFLDMSSAEIDALAAPAWQKTIYHAMATYGMFVGDTGGDSWGIQFESGSSYTSFGYQDPWSKLGEQLDLPSWDGAADGQTRYVYDFANAINWASRLVVAAP